MKLINKKFLILPVVALSLFAISNSIFASDSINCPKGYICLKTNDPLIMASTSPCLQQDEVFVYKIKIPDEYDNVSKGDSLSFDVYSRDQDHVGVWDVFKPGVSSSGVKEDWGWNATIFLTKPKTIQSITIINNDGSEGWSTSKDERLFGKFPYPLVVIDEKGKQLNNSYDQTFKIAQGTTTLNLYGQMETPSLNNPEIVIIFTDHTYVTTSVAEIQENSQDGIAIPENKSIWGRLKGLFGF